MLRDFTILYLSSKFVQNHLPSVFHMHSSVCSSLLCIRDSWVSLSQSFIVLYYSKLWECMFQNTLLQWFSTGGPRRGSAKRFQRVRENFEIWKTNYEFWNFLLFIIAFWNRLENLLNCLLWWDNTKAYWDLSPAGKAYCDAIDCELYEKTAGYSDFELLEKAHNHCLSLACN